MFLPGPAVSCYAEAMVGEVEVTVSVLVDLSVANITGVLGELLQKDFRRLAHIMVRTPVTFDLINYIARFSCHA